MTDLREMPDLPQRIEAAQFALDIIRDSVAGHARRYDAAPNDSQTKRDAIAAMKSLTYEALNVERQLDELSDAYTSRKISMQQT